MSLASSSGNFISQVCEAFRKAVERASGVTLEGREREFRRVLVRHLFDEVLGWNGHSKVGEIYDIACFDDEDFPIIIVETKWNVKLTPEIKEKLRRRIEELGSVKYGIFASEREFLIYEFRDYELREVTKVNVAEAVGVAKQEFGLSRVAKKRILKLESLKRERLVWIEEPEYFEKTYKEISVAKGEGVKLLTENLKAIVSDLTTVLMNFFDSYSKRKDHYSGKFLENTFNDWLKISMKDEEFKGSNETKRRDLIEVFCRETAYVLLGRVLFTRICEDKVIIGTMVSGKGIAESLVYYGKRRIEDVYLRLFNETREEIKKYYSHLHELGFFDWWVIEEVRKDTLLYDDRKIQDSLEKDLDYSIKKALRRLNRFDFTQVNRDILGDVYQGYLPPDERKRLGEFYTPTEVIEYILDAVGYNPENEIRGKKILDPACGSGSFLVEATQRLIERYRKKGFSLRDSDEAKQIIEGCTSSIFGLDIHPFACFIAEMNLLFQIVDLYDAVRQKYKYYELPRLNVYRTDSLASLGEIIELAEFFDNSRRVMLVEETKGANKIKNTEFDYVVGNPPYIRSELIPDIARASYKKHFTSSTGRFDIYVLFVERTIKWLNSRGRSGLITSNKFMQASYGRGLREFIVKNCTINQFIDFGDSGVFSEVTNYPSISILSRDAMSDNIFNFVRIKKATDNLLQLIKAHITDEEYHDEYVSIFRVNQSSLKKDIWKFMPKEANEAFYKIKEVSVANLGDICRAIEEGIKTQRDRVFIIHEDVVKEHNIELDIVKAVLKGRNVRRWNIGFKKLYLIYPHKIVNSKLMLVDISDYQFLKKYLEKFDKALRLRHCVKVERKAWYELDRPRKPSLFEVESKIITPCISNRNNFAMDQKRYYYSNSCCVLIPRSEKIEPKYLLGLLNSKVLEFYIKQLAPMISGGYYQYKPQYLKLLPIKLPRANKEREFANQIVHKVSQILQVAEQMHSLKEKIMIFPYSYLENNWSFGRLMNILKMQSLSKPAYTVSEKSLRTHYLKDLESKEIFRINLAPNEFIEFSSEEVASYVLEALKTRTKITKRELLELEIPSEDHLKKVLNLYRKDKERIVKNKKIIEDLEKQIDDLVYKLYNITYAQRRIIEDFVKKF